MGTTIVYVLIPIVLFVVSFFAKRRFGLLGLALAAGSLLSGVWGYDAGLIASGLGFPSNIYVDSIISSIIILLPSILLLFHGYAYKNVFSRTIGALMYTILAMALLFVPLISVFPPSGIGSSIINAFSSSSKFIVGVCLIGAVIDLFLTKPSDNSKKHR